MKLWIDTIFLILTHKITLFKFQKNFFLFLIKIYLQLINNLTNWFLSILDQAQPISLQKLSSSTVQKPESLTKPCFLKP